VSKPIGGYIKSIEPHMGKTLALASGIPNILFSGGYDCAITASKFDDIEKDTCEVKMFGHQAPVSTLLLVS